VDLLAGRTARVARLIVAAVTLSVVDDRKPYRGEAEGAVSVIGTGTLSFTLLLLLLLVLVLSVDMMIYTDD
jgi:hypothetical protein